MKIHTKHINYTLCEWRCSSCCCLFDRGWGQWCTAALKDRDRESNELHGTSWLSTFKAAQGQNLTDASWRLPDGLKLQSKGQSLNKRHGGNWKSDHLKSLVTCNNISWSHFIAEFLTPDRTENKNSFTDDNLSFVHFLHTVSVCHTGGFTPDVKDIRSASAVTVCQFFMD